MDDLIYVLPDEEEFLSRLAEFIVDPYTAERLHEPFARDHAGEHVNALGLILAWLVACGEFARSSGLPEIMGKALRVSAGPYMHKLVGDDAEFYAQVKTYLVSMGFPVEQ